MKKILTALLITCACTNVYGAATATSMEVPTSEAARIKEFTEKSSDFIEWAMKYYYDKLSENDFKTNAMLAGKAKELSNAGIVISTDQLKEIMNNSEVEKLIRDENRHKYSTQEKPAETAASTSEVSADKNINSLPEARWQIVFPGLTATTTPGGDYQVKNIVQQIFSSLWNGKISSGYRYWGSTYDPQTRQSTRNISPNINKYGIYTLDANELQQVVDEIVKATGIDSTRFSFSKPTWEKADPNSDSSEYITLNSFTSAIEVPFENTEILTAMADRFDEIKTAITNGAKRKSPTSFGKNLGQTWQMVNDFIGTFATGVHELQLLLDDKFVNDFKSKIYNFPAFDLIISPDEIEQFKETTGNSHFSDEQVKQAIKANYAKSVQQAAVLAADTISAYQKVNDEFEKTAKDRNPEKINKACDDFKITLDKILDFIGAKAVSGFNPKIRKLIEFSYTVPAIYKWHAAIAAKNKPLDLSVVTTAAREKTTAEILDNKFLNKPQTDLADKVKNSATGDLVTTLKINNKKWNVYKITAPEVDDKLLDAAAAEIKANGMRIVGTHPMLVRMPRQDINAYWIVDFDVSANGDVHFSAGNNQRSSSPNRYYNSFSNRFGNWGTWEPVILGAIEVRPVADGDRTLRNYDPMRVHAIHGTMMEHRIHNIMEQNKVHNFNKLPEDEQTKLMGEVDRYNYERYRNNLENQGFGKYTLESDEISNKHPEGSPERIHATQNRMEKISGEFKARLALARYNRFRTHGGDLTENPEELARMRVHEITGNLITHEMRKLQNMSPREREFFRENHKDGYLNVVETAIAEKNRRVDAEHMRTHGYPLHQEPRVHDVNRTHFELAPYQVAEGVTSAQSATGNSYTNVANALADYDMYDGKIPTKEQVRTPDAEGMQKEFGKDNIGKNKTYSEVPKKIN
jgi:hypothetical protein